MNNTEFQQILSEGIDFLAFQVEEQKDAQIGCTPALLTNVPAPWLAMQYIDRKVSPLVRLHNEILSFVEYITPTIMEYKQRDTVLSEITHIIKTLWPDAQVKIFGSQMTRILTPTSDLDLAMLNIPDPKPGERSALELLSDAILARGNVTYCEVISSAKVPIIKMDHKLGISVDVCCNNDTGLNTGAFIKQMVNQYPPLRPLTMVLKVFLSQRRLNETYTGGIGSFVLSSMIVSFLQHRIRLSKARKVALSWNLGSLLLDFLQLYGTTFNYVHTGVSISGHGSYFEKRKRSDGEWGTLNSGRPQVLSIENPMQPELDMGRNSFMMPKIRRAFEHALQLLSAALANRSCDSYLAFVIRTDDAMLTGRDIGLLSTKSRARQQFVAPEAPAVVASGDGAFTEDQDNGEEASQSVSDSEESCGDVQIDTSRWEDEESDESLFSEADYDHERQLGVKKRKRSR